MSKDIYNTVLEELAVEFLTKGGSYTPLFNDMLTDLALRKKEEYILLNKKPTEEELRKELDVFFKLISESIQKKRGFRDELYKRSYDKLKVLVDSGTTFGDIFTEIYSDESYLNDIFIRLVEEKEGVLITSAKQLQELTGITEIYGYWDSEKGETIQYKDKTISTKKEAKEEAKKQIEETFTAGMYSRYSSVLECMLEAGAKYKDIVIINPKDFNLPEKWSGTLATNKEEVILWAISFTYLINEPAGLMMLPNLRLIAEEIEAPYSVLMDCFKLFNK
jgi:hypothetical protein